MADILLGGYDEKDVMDYVAIATTGNATDFGNLTEGRIWPKGMTNNTRGVFAGGSGSTYENQTATIDYITIDTTGNATDFGDLPAARKTFGTASDGTTGVMAGGYNQTQGNYFDILNITIDTAGNATDSTYSHANPDRGYMTGCSGD